MGYESPMGWWKSESDGIRLTLQIVPRASRSEVVGPHGDALKIRLQAPPVEGRANEALREFLADRFDVPRAAIRIEHGQTGRRKQVFIAGDPAQLAPAQRLAAT